MRCEDCGKEFSFIKNNTLCSACLLKETNKKKEESKKEKGSPTSKNDSSEKSKRKGV